MISPSHFLKWNHISPFDCKNTTSNLYFYLTCLFSLCIYSTKDFLCLGNMKVFSYTWREANTETSFFFSTLSKLHTWNNSLTSWREKRYSNPHLWHIDCQGQNTVQLPAEHTLPTIQLNSRYFWQGWKVSNSQKKWQ